MEAKISVQYVKKVSKINFWFYFWQTFNPSNPSRLFVLQDKFTNSLKTSF